MYDAALVRLRGAAAATNFALADYRHDLAAYQKMQQARSPPCPVINRLGLHLGRV